MQHATYICDLFNSSATLCLYILNGAGPNGTGEDGVKERFGIRVYCYLCDVHFMGYFLAWESNVGCYIECPYAISLGYIGFKGSNNIVKVRKK